MGKAGASARVIDEWCRRVEAEYRSTAIASNLALWLVQVGASPDLVKAALRIAREELAHATMSHAVYVAACRPGPAADLGLDRATLELSRTEGDPLEWDLTRACLEVFCLGETVAVRLFKELRQRCDVPVARRVLDRVLKDEVGHREFGWTLLAWLLDHPQHGPALRSLVRAELPGAFARIRALYGPEALQAQSTLPRHDARWGLMPPARYGQLLQACFEKDYAPRFRKLGIDAGSCWKAQGPALASP